jgi:hypothetical protein
MYGRIIAALNARFARCFTPDGEDYLYRWKPEAQPTRVTARGHQMLIDGFHDRAGWWTTGVLVVVGILATSIYISLAATVPASPQDVIDFYLFLALLHLAIIAGWVDLWDYPRRALFRGLIERNELQRSWFRNWGYDTTWLALLYGAGFILFHWLRPNGTFSNFWAFMATIFFFIIVFAAIQKFRLIGEPLLPNLDQPHTRDLPR